jgi:hypothetical protein
MPTIKNNLFQLSGNLLLLVLLISCSNKMVVSEKSFTVPGKKIAFNSIILCSPGKFNNSSFRNWYSGNSKTSTSLGELTINFNFCMADLQPGSCEDAFYNFFPLWHSGDIHPGPGPFHAVITLDRKNSLWVEYPEVNYKSDLILFGVDGQVTGGTGMFMNATGTINSKILTGKMNNIATTIHMGVVYLQ